MKLNMSWILLLPVALLMAAAAPGGSPRCFAGDGSEYFEPVSAELKAHGVARPMVLIDLDRLDQNLAVLNSHIQPPLKFRVVEKSLPCFALIKYILDHTGSNRVSGVPPSLPAVADGRSCRRTISYLFGKTVLIDGVKEYLAGLTPAQRVQSTEKVQWLIDSAQTLREYIDFFHSQGLKVSAANVEIDGPGAQAGGAENPGGVREHHEPARGQHRHGPVFEGASWATTAM